MTVLETRRPLLLLPEGHPLRRHVLYRARLLQSQP